MPTIIKFYAIMKLFENYEVPKLRKKKRRYKPRRYTGYTVYGTDGKNHINAKRKLVTDCNNMISRVAKNYCSSIMHETK